MPKAVRKVRRIMALTGVGCFGGTATGIAASRRLVGVGAPEVSFGVGGQHVLDHGEVSGVDKPFRIAGFFILYQSFLEALESGDFVGVGLLDGTVFVEGYGHPVLHTLYEVLIKF